MPQMAPLNWLMLFIIFSLTFLYFNNLNFFSFLYTPKSTSSKKKTLKLSWKW